MRPVRNLAGLATWPAIAIILVIALTAAFLWLGEGIPTIAAALLTASSIVFGLGSWAAWHYPPVYFWRQRFWASVGRRQAPAWKLRLMYRSRSQADDRSEVAERLIRRGLRVEDRVPRELEVVRGATHLTLHWEDPDVEAEEADPPNWFVSVAVDYPPIAYHESIRFLRSSVMPILEVVESALDVTPDRSYRLVVEYPRGHNPFEGLLIRAAPDTTVANYSVMLRPDPTGEERIELSQERLTLTAVTRSRFEELVERLLTLDGSWPVAFLDSLQ